MSIALAFPDSLETERLLLRKPVIEDAKVIFTTYATDPDVARFMTWIPHKDLQETVEFVSSCIQDWSDHKSWPYVIMSNEVSHNLLGMIHLHRTKHDISVGYVLAKSCWGQGIATEALQSVVDLCFTQQSVYRVSTYCDLENVASARVMEKAGLTFEGMLKRYEIAPCLSSEPRDCKLYAVTR